jgi:hypothetical protein
VCNEGGVFSFDRVPLLTINIFKSIISWNVAPCSLMEVYRYVRVLLSACLLILLFGAEDGGIIGPLKHQ